MVSLPSRALHRVKICLFLNPDTLQVSWRKNLNNFKHLKKPNVGIPFFKILASNFCVLCKSICKYTLKIWAGLYECSKDKCHSSEGKTKHLLHFASLAKSVVSLIQCWVGIDFWTDQLVLVLYHLLTIQMSMVVRVIEFIF